MDSLYLPPSLVKVGDTSAIPSPTMFLKYSTWAALSRSRLGARVDVTRADVYDLDGDLAPPNYTAFDFIIYGK